jgi:hypothetical protein
VPDNARSGNSRQPRTAEVVFCFDCGYVGNRPDEHKGVVYGWEKPWDELVCPECGESAGPWVKVVEVIED